MVKRWRTEGVMRGTVSCHRGNRGGSLITGVSCLLAVALLFEAHPAWAQISKVNTVMTNVQTVLVGVAVTLFTVAIMWAGFKMAFQQAQWSEISNLVIGGILVGGAAGIAAWLVN